MFACPHAQEVSKKILPALKIEELLSPEYNKCYCNLPTCQPNARARNDGRGCTPQGFTRFGIAINTHHANSRGVFSSWGKAYHGTQHSFIAPIAKLGYLLTPGSVSTEGVEIGIRDGHLTKDSVVKINLESLRSGRSGLTGKVKLTNTGELTSEFHPERCVFLTKNHAYAACPVYAETATLNGVKCTIILEFRLMPKSFDCGSHTVTSNVLTKVKEQCDNKFTAPDSEWEEFTDRFGVMLLTGVCIRIADFKPPTSSSSSIPKAMSSPTTFDGGIDVARAKRAWENFAKFSSCPTASRRYQILQQLGLPESMFDREFFICYCEKCHPDKGKVYTRAGMTYRLPHGFTGFSLYIDEARFKAFKIFEKFPVAYHGTTRQGAPKIVHAGMLIPAGTKGPDGEVVGHRENNKPESDDIKRISFSPVVGYATHPSNATPSTINLRGTPREVRFALQLRVDPKCYAEKPSVISGFKIADAEKVYEGKEEWYTPRHGCVFVYRLLISDADVVPASPVPETSKSLFSRVFGGGQ